MTECFIKNENDDALCCCDNCGHEERAGDLDMISDIQERLDPGGVVPAGQCTECGALSYLKVKPEWAKPARAESSSPIAVIIEGGIVQGVVSHDPSMVGRQFIVIDYDTEGADADDLADVDQGDGTSQMAFKPMAQTVGSSSIVLPETR